MPAPIIRIARAVSHAVVCRAFDKNGGPKAERADQSSGKPDNNKLASQLIEEQPANHRRYYDTDCHRAKAQHGFICSEMKNQLKEQ